MNLNELSHIITQPILFTKTQKQKLKFTIYTLKQMPLRYIFLILKNVCGLPWITARLQQLDRPLESLVSEEQ
jgi:hypothetical protein